MILDLTFNDTELNFRRDPEAISKAIYMVMFQLCQILDNKTETFDCVIIPPPLAESMILNDFCSNLFYFFI